jgi:hypothetical protein
MPNTYNNNFSFNPKDIALIEEGLRTLSEHHDTIMMIRDGDGADFGAIETKVRKLKQVNELLGKIYNQKIFYSQTHSHDGVPLG